MLAFAQYKKADSSSMVRGLVSIYLKFISSNNKNKWYLCRVSSVICFHSRLQLWWLQWPIKVTFNLVEHNPPQIQPFGPFITNSINLIQQGRKHFIHHHAVAVQNHISDLLCTIIIFQRVHCLLVAIWSHTMKLHYDILSFFNFLFTYYIPSIHLHVHPLIHP